MAQRSFDFAGADGQKLSGLLDLPEGQAQAYALFAHCFTCTKNSLAAVRIARALTARGFGVLRFDFTGWARAAAISATRPSAAMCRTWLPPPGRWPRPAWRRGF